MKSLLHHYDVTSFFTPA